MGLRDAWRDSYFYPRTHLRCFAQLHPRSPLALGRAGRVRLRGAAVHIYTETGSTVYRRRRTAAPARGRHATGHGAYGPYPVSALLCAISMLSRLSLQPLYISLRVHTFDLTSIHKYQRMSRPPPLWPHLHSISTPSHITHSHETTLSRSVPGGLSAPRTLSSHADVRHLYTSKVRAALAMRVHRSTDLAGESTIVTRGAVLLVGLHSSWRPRLYHE